MNITPRDREVLGNLRAAVDNWISIGAGEWVRPLDCGAWNGSDHSYRLTKLSKAGLARRRKTALLPGGRGSCRYTITEAGREVLADADT